MNSNDSKVQRETFAIELSMNRGTFAIYDLHMALTYKPVYVDNTVPTF